MKRLLFGCFAFGIAVAFAAPAQAAALSLLTADGNVDFLEDDDYESIIDLSTGSVVTSPASAAVGNAFVGVFELQRINGTAAVTSTITAVLAARIDDITGSTLTFGALSDGEYASLAGYFPSLPGRSNSATAVIAYEDSATPFLNLGGTIDDAIASASDGTEVFEFGFVGSTYAQAFFNPVVAGDFAFRLALNVTENSTWFEFLEVTTAETGVMQLDGSDLPAADLHVGGGDGNGSPGPFTFRTDADLFVNVVPEPGSMTMLAIFGGTLVVAGYRRRAAKKCAA